MTSNQILMRKYPGGFRPMLGKGRLSFVGQASIRELAAGAGELTHNIANKIFGVTEKHERLVEVIQRIVDSREARSHAALDDHNCPGLVHVEDGHPVNRASGIGASSRISHV